MRTNKVETAVQCSRMSHVVHAGCPCHDNPMRKDSQKKKKKKNYRILNFTVPADHIGKIKESEKTDKYLDLARELKIMEYEGDGITNFYRCTWNNPQKIGKKDCKTLKSEDETILSKRLSRSDRMPRRVLEIRGHSLSLKLQ